MKHRELTTEQWEAVRPLLPRPDGAQRGRPSKDDRIMLNAILYWLDTGVVWRELPARYGPWQSVYCRLRSWQRQGIWKPLLRALREQQLVDETRLPVNSILFRAHSRRKD